jgi:flavin-dependent dehydrogenase
VVILGAGVAGAAAAILASKQGLKTLLVDAKSFPREKVCGGCLNLRSQASLDRLGVLQPIAAAGAVRIESMQLKVLTTQAQWPVPAMLSVRRSTLDAILVDRAIACGSQFIDRTVGSLSASTVESGASTRSVRLQSNGDTVVVASKSVLVASGLTRSSLRQEDHGDWPANVANDSRIGVQCLIPESQAVPFADGCLHMLVGHQGYVGICKTDGGLLDVAAAIDPSSIPARGGIRQVVQGIFAECGFGEIELPEKEQWLATPSLTRCSTRVSDHRVFLIGDAIGYVEPFTGEGMSWALASAESVMPLIAEIAALGWRDDMGARWNDWAHRQRIHKHRTCRWIAGQVRWPRGAAWVLRACNWLPPLRASLIRKTSQ